MAISIVSRYLSYLVVAVFFFFFSALPRETLGANPPFAFTIERFVKNQSFDSEIALYGDAKISDSMVTMTSKGRIMYRKPIRVLGKDPGFSTYFSFSISPGKGGGLAFSVEPNDGRRFGLSTSVLAVGFVASVDANSSENHIEIDVASGISIKSSNLSRANLVLDDDKKLYSWIDYDGVSKKLEVRLSKSRALKPSTSLLSYPINLSDVLSREAIFVGISSWSGNSNQTSRVHSWSFVLKDGAPYLMHSEPLDPDTLLVRPNVDHPVNLRRNYRWRIIVALVLGAAFGAVVTLSVIFMWSVVSNRRPVAPVDDPVLPAEIGYEKVVLVGDKTVSNAAK